MLHRHVCGGAKSAPAPEQVSCAAHTPPHSPCLAQVITNIHSKRKTPTVIGFYKGERLFGADAEQISTRKPKFVLRNPQTLLGRNMSDPIVQAHAAQPFVGYDIVPSAHGGVALRLAPHEDSFPEGRTFTAEELTGMLLAYAKHFASIFAGGAPISDAIITVPAFFTQQHRLAMLDAAALAGLRVLALLDENTAAGVQYGIDKVHTNTTNLLMFNSGSARTQATVIQYTAYKAKGFGKGKVGQGEVLGACWEDGVGGASVTQALLNLLADAVNAKHSKALEGADIRTLARPISKLLKAAKKAKEVLSANTEYTVYVESLTPNIDFSHKVRRADLEQAAAPFLAGAMKPIACALEAANLTLADIHAVELIGGSVRVPAMQALLKETFAPANLTLGMHMNGDEAMALGAAFVAANRSTSFRVRQVGMVSTTPFSVGVELTDLPGAEVDTPLSKRSTLFKAGNKLGNLKKLSLKHSTDMVASLAYTSDAPLPASAQTFLAAYNITGLAAAVANHSTLDAPKVSLTFQLDHNGIVRVTKAEAVFEEWVEPAATTPEAVKEAESSPSPTAEPASEDKDSAAEDSTAEDSPDAEGTAKDEKEDADKGADAADENTATATPEPTAIPQPKRKLIRVPLTVTLADTPDFTRAMNSSEMEASAAVLAALQAIDDAKAKREAAKSSLESYIYASRGQMGELYEEVEAVSTEEQREAISTALEETEDWLYDEGDNTSLDKYLSKDAELKALVQPVLERVKEAAERPAAIKSARKFIVSTEASLADWNETRPWVSHRTAPHPHTPWHG